MYGEIFRAGKKIEAVFEAFKQHKLQGDLVPLTAVKGENLNRIGQCYIALNQEAEAMPFLIKAACEFNNKCAHQILGEIYYKNNHFKKACYHLEKSPMTNHKIALLLADLYDRGYGNEEKTRKKLKARDYYQAAEEWALREPPNAIAYCNVALFYHLKKLGPDIKEGLYWQKAADLGNANAQHRAARLLEEGLGGLTQDIKAAIKRYRQSIDQNYIPAFHDLANLLESLAGDENLKEAYNLYAQAAPGLSKSKIDKARCLCGGLGVSKDVAQGMAIFEEMSRDFSCKDNHSKIYHNLGILYFEEFGNFAKALEYLQLGANLGDPGSQFAIAGFYEFGLGLEEADSAAALIWLEKAAQSTDQTVATRAVITLKALKMRLRSSELLTAFQQEDKNPKEILSEVNDILSVPPGDYYQDKPAFKKLNQVLVQTAKNPDLYRNEKIRALFAHIVTANYFDHINLVTALFNIGGLFHNINNQPQAINEYKKEIKILINRLQDRMPHLEVRETANALHGLSLLHLNAGEEPIIHCIRLLLIRAEKNLSSFTSQDLDMAICAIARFNLAREELQRLQCLIREIQNRWAEFNLDQLIHLAYAFAVLDVYQKEIKYRCFKAGRLGSQIFSKIIAKIPADSKTLPIQLRSQLDLGWRYFKQNYPMCKVDPASLALGPIVYQNNNSPWMSQFQKEVTAFIRRHRVPTQHDIQTEVSIKELPPVDIYSSDDNTAIQANGPTHYYYSLEQKSQPAPTLKEQFHRHLFMKECKLVDISCFEWSKQKNNNERSAYLSSLGLKLVSIPGQASLIKNQGIQKEWRKKSKPPSSAQPLSNSSDCVTTAIEPEFNRLS